MRVVAEARQLVGLAGQAWKSAALAALIADSRLSPQLGVVRRWSETVEAVEALRSRQATGNVVLTHS